MSRKLLLRALLIFFAGGVLLATALGAVYVARDYGAARISSTASGDRTFAEPGSVPIGGPFTLVDHTGWTVTDEGYRGKYLLVFFGFTHCPDICPTTLYEISQTLKQLGGQASAVQPLFISVDPARDTPETLATYVKAFDPRIVGLTGSKARIDDVVRAYRAFYEIQDGTGSTGTSSAQSQTTASGANSYLVSHTSYTYLMSPKGEYLAHFSYGTKPERMVGTIREAIARFGLPTGGNS